MHDISEIWTVMKQSSINDSGPRFSNMIRPTEEPTIVQDKVVRYCQVYEIARSYSSEDIPDFPYIIQQARALIYKCTADM